MRRAVDYYSYTWGDADANETSLISELPQDLQTDVLFYLMKDVIEKVPFFQGCEIPFLRSLVNQLEPVIASPGEYLV